MIELNSLDPADLAVAIHQLALEEPNSPVIVALRLVLEQVDLAQERRRAMIEASHAVCEGIDFLDERARQNVLRARATAAERNGTATPCDARSRRLVGES